MVMTTTTKLQIKCTDFYTNLFKYILFPYLVVTYLLLWLWFLLNILRNNRRFYVNMPKC